MYLMHAYRVPAKMSSQCRRESRGGFPLEDPCFQDNYGYCVSRLSVPEGREIPVT